MKVYLLLTLLALQGCAIDDYITKHSTPKPSASKVSDCGSLQAQIDQIRMENQALRAQLAQMPPTASPVQPASVPVKPVPTPPPAIKVTPPFSDYSPSPSPSQQTYSLSGATYQPAVSRTTYKAPSVVPSTQSYSTSSGYYRGPRGGCYTYSSSGRKRYVDRSLCN
jgi:hypothetical protein